jgi:hypothetical protein
MSAALALMNPTPGGHHHTAPRMSYVGLMVQFNRLNSIEPFDVYERSLYIVLLGFFNDRDKEWNARQEEFADVFLCMATTIKSVNTLKKAREGLERRGLIRFDGGKKGRTHKGRYEVLMLTPAAALPAPEKPALKVSSDDSLNDSFTASDELKLSRKLSDKVSSDDTNLESVRGQDSSNGRAAALEKKIAGHQFSGPENDSAADGSSGADEGTGGATDVGTRLIPLPLAEGEYIPGGFVDSRLPDTDPRKWEARPPAGPAGAEMVNAYLATLPDKRQHVGKGQLFIDYYEGKGWCTGKEGLTPIRNWRAVARQFSFVDYSAQREKQAAATVGSQVERRLSTAERVREKLRKEAGNE